MDFKMTYTTIAIVILVIDMGMLTLAVKCNDAAGVVDCVAAKVCKYEAGSLTGERCSNDEALVDEIGKCVKKPATGMDQTPDGKDTCCIQADDTKTGGWVKDGNGPSDCTWKV